MRKASEDPIERLIESSFEIGRVMRHHMKFDGKEHGVNFLQIHALIIINEQKGITMKQLADALHVTSPSATSFVNRLVKLGWVERLHDPANRKLVRLRITVAGGKLLRIKMERRQKMIRELFSLLTPHEQSMLADLQDKIVSKYNRPSQS
jgi:DNA-binding MarR family transcriptional regulator